jgi:WD40 repeat protein/transcriptional regulator with XRE-family HTH domain
MSGITWLDDFPSNEHPRMADFRGLLLTYRGRSGFSQRELADQIGASVRAVQTWEAGLSYPAADRLKALIALYVNKGVFTSDRVEDEARQLWNAALDEAPRFEAPFDGAWFSSLQPDFKTTSSAAGVDLGDVPAVGTFLGRTAELDTLLRWLLADDCRLVALLGFGGIGKSTLASRLTRQLAPQFEYVYWRSARNAPTCAEWLAGAILTCSNQSLLPAEDERTRLRQLVELLRTKRCLLVLDNFETLLASGADSGGYRAGYDGYEAVLLAIATHGLRGRLLLTSRESPPGFDDLRESTPAVRSLYLQGLSPADCRLIMADKQLKGDDADWDNLVTSYSGNALALKIVGETIHELFGGDIASFLLEGEAVFGGVRQLLSEQFDGLPYLEKAILAELAVSCEPAGIARLTDALQSHPQRREVMEAVQALIRRSLLERSERAAEFTLQPLVQEFVIDRIVGYVAEEIRTQRPDYLRRHALIRAHGTEHARRSQERLVGLPLLERLSHDDPRFGGRVEIASLLDAWRGGTAIEQGFGPGNIANLLRLRTGTLQGADLSRLVLRQLILAVPAQDANLSGSTLIDPLLAEPFEEPTSTTLSPDGSLLAAGMINGEVRIWRVAGIVPVLASVVHTGVVMGVAVSEDGSTLASCGVDGTVQLWNTATGDRRAQLRGHTAAVRVVALSADGSLVASGGLDKSVRLWNPQTGDCIAVLEGHTDGIRGIALSADGRLAASCSLDGTSRLWDTAEAREITVLWGHDGPVWDVALPADGRILASCGVDGTVRLWDTESGQNKAILQGHRGSVRAVALSSDGELAASGGSDETLRLWDTNTARPLAVLEGHTSTVWDVALSGDGRLAASGGGDGSVRIWQTDTRQCLAVIKGFSTTVWGVAVSADGRVAASVGATGRLRLWDTETGVQTAALEGHTAAAWSVALAGRIAATAGGDESLRLWDISSGWLLASLAAPTATFRTIALSADAALAASGGTDSRVRLWDVASRTCVAEMVGHIDAIRAVALSADGRLAASCGADTTVRLWDTETRECLAVLEGHAGPVWGLALSADGGLAASASLDGTVRLWDTFGARCVDVLDDHSGPVTSVALSADGRFVASGGADSTVRLHLTENPSRVAVLQGHTGTVYGVALSADGGIVVSGGGDGTARVWSGRTSEQLRVLKPDRIYERMDISRVRGLSPVQLQALRQLGAIDEDEGFADLGALAAPRQAVL